MTPGSQIGVVGAGYVGLVTALGLAEAGFDIVVSEADGRRLDGLRRQEIPFFEPGLFDLLTKHATQRRIRFTASNADAAQASPMVFIAVPTPANENGDADLSIVERVVDEVAPTMAPGSVLVIKSTVPPGTGDRLQARIAVIAPDVEVVSNPEFLRQGRAVADTLQPDRVVIGGVSEAAIDRVASLYSGASTRIVRTDRTTAELTKHAANAYLAVRLSFVNATANLAEAVDADIDEVLEGLGLDPRIGRGFLSPGPGFGGSCLPKDSRALLAAAADAGFDFGVLRAAIAANDAQAPRMVDKIERAAGTLDGARVAMWGVAFKAGTDDTRESPALRVARILADRGASVVACDPMVTDFPTFITVVDDPLDAVDGADVLVVATEWPAFLDVELKEVAARMARPRIVDMRNLLDADEAARAGFDYVGVGRRPAGPAFT